MPEKPKVEICAGFASLDGNRIPLQNVELLKVVDSGAHGTVFGGLDLNLGRKIAVKLWYRTGETVHEGAVAKARKLAMVSHPLFATVYHFDAIGTTPYSVMELLPGPSLRKWLKIQGNIKISDRYHINYLQSNQR